MAAPVRGPTNAELCAQADALPEPLVGEVIAGALYTMGRPAPAHANVEMELVSDLRRGPPGGQPPVGWYIQAEVEIRFANDEKVIPDLSGWRPKRIAGLARGLALGSGDGLRLGRLRRLHLGG